jgi:hypothetical protein
MKVAFFCDAVLCSLVQFKRSLVNDSFSVTRTRYIASNERMTGE